MTYRVVGAPTLANVAPQLVYVGPGEDVGNNVSLSGGQGMDGS